MTDLDRAILEAWGRVGESILGDADELARRVARRRSASMQWQMRHWCIAVRASDRRITPMHWVITPAHAMDRDHPEHPYRPIEHEVLIQTYALRKFCRPVGMHEWGEEVGDVAKALGVTPSGLRTARNREFFREERRIRGLGGKRGCVVPLISSKRPLDPGNGNCFEPPHPICGNLWQHLPDVLDEDFEQAVMRRPVFREMGRRRRRLEDGRMGGWVERAPEDHQYRDEMRFMGWRWVCPGCKKEVRTIYYPIEVRTMCYYLGFDPARSQRSEDRSQKSEDRSQRSEDGRQKRICEVDEVPRPLASFACYKCHGIQSFWNTSSGGWNLLVSRHSAGLLYGQEVRPPEWFRPGELRKRRRCRQVARQAPRREQVLRRLLNGWSVRRICRDMQVTRNTVEGMIRILCEQENVADRHELAAKLGARTSPPLNQIERAAKRRVLVMEMLVQGKSYREIMAELGLDFSTVNRDADAIYKMYEVGGKGKKASRALAEKLGREIPGRRSDVVRRKICGLRECGLGRREIAEEMKLSVHTVGHYLARIRREEKLARSNCELSTVKGEV